MGSREWPSSNMTCSPKRRSGHRHREARRGCRQVMLSSRLRRTSPATPGSDACRVPWGSSHGCPSDPYSFLCKASVETAPPGPLHPQGSTRGLEVRTWPGCPSAVTQISGVGSLRRQTSNSLNSPNMLIVPQMDRPEPLRAPGRSCLSRLAWLPPSHWRQSSGSGSVRVPDNARKMAPR